MTRVLTILSVAALAALPSWQADARPTRVAAKPHVAAKPLPSAAVRTRQAAMNGFSTRMGRLDALMGAPSTRPARSRSADAGR